MNKRQSWRKAWRQILTRGYSDDDLRSVRAKFCSAKKPGELTLVTLREMKALAADQKKETAA